MAAFMTTLTKETEPERELLLTVLKDLLGQPHSVSDRTSATIKKLGLDLERLKREG
jgi:hypothetical protein